MKNEKPHENQKSPFDSDKYENQRCTAKSKRSGQRCKNYAIKGATTCRFHGGTAGKGIMSPAFKTGRYSKHITNANLLDSYQRILVDDDLLSLKNEVALLAARNSELIDKMNDQNSRQLWRDLRDHYKRFRTAVDEKDREQHLREILRTIERGGKDFEIWDEILGNMETQRKLSDSERKRILDAKLMITADQAMALVVALVNSFKHNVQKYATDSQTANRILSATGRDVDALIGQNGGVNVESRN